MAKMSPRVAERQVKKATPKGGGKGARGEKLYTPVSQATIDKIKKMGMTKALAAAGKTQPGQRAEFIQGIRRMYGANRLAAARKANKPAASAKMSPRAAERARPAVKKASPKVAERMPAAKKAVAAAPKNDLMARRKAQAERARARFKGGLPQDVIKLGGSSKPKAKKAAPKPFVPGGRNR
jgi:hypothetical protein